MTVVACPLCSTHVNAAASRCPDCGADIHLDRDRAMAELFGRRVYPSCSIEAHRLKPGWPLQVRLLVTLPGLVAPAWLIIRAAQAYIHEYHLYYSLPVDVRTEDGDPLSAAADMYFASFGVFCGLLLVGLALSVSLPRRLWPWWGGIASFFALIAVYLFVDLEAPVGLAYLCLPALVVVRVVWQRHAGGELGLQRRLAGPREA